jgi:octanoyl-[GcvH]:protein N-octanoyltransferase
MEREDGSAEPLLVLRDSYPSPPGLDTAISSVLLRRVSEGTFPEAIRVHRPGDLVAFGPKDRHEPGFGAAVAAARAQGFDVVERLAGGRAAVFHGGTVSFSWIVPDPTPRLRIRERFERLSGAVAGALRSLGVDARVGEVPGEYCPGEFSVNARGTVKVMGVGQRLVQHAAHVGGVVVVSGADRIREVLIPVYEALGLAWDPSTVGAVAEEVPGVGWDDTAAALESALAIDREVRRSAIPSDLVDEARQESTRFIASSRS